MASSELQSIMARMRDLFSAHHDGGDAEQRGGRPETQAQGINEEYYKRVESFTGEQAWRDWSFQFKSATKTANEAAYHLIEMAEKEEEGD